MKIKYLLYCTKGNLSLYRDNIANEFFTMKPREERYSNSYDNIGMQNRLYNDENCTRLNGTIAAGCDIEKITKNDLIFDRGFNEETQLSLKDIGSYVGEKKYHCLHLSNVKAFEEPMELSEFSTLEYVGKEGDFKSYYIKDLKRAPQNMCRVYDNEGNCYILISIQPQWLCKILNGEKTIEVRKQILNCMK